MEYVTLLANQKSSKFNLKIMEKCKQLLTDQGYKVNLALTTTHDRIFAFDFKRKLLKYSKESDKIICYGGDGLYGLICQIFNKNYQTIPLGFVSIGTANDMAKNLNLSQNPIEATNQIIHGKEKEHDIITLNNVGFGYVSAFGPITSVTYNTDYRLKKALGKFGYMISAIPEIVNLINGNTKPYNITYEANQQKKQAKCLIGLVTNAKSFAGINIYNDAYLDDGLFEFLMVKQEALTSAPDILGDFIKNFSSDKLNLDIISTHPEAFEIVKTNDLNITFHDIPLTSFNHDGDEGPKPCQKVHYQAKNKIKLLLPKK